jgi:hypothetical protein
MKKFRVTFWPSIDIAAETMEQVQETLEKMAVRHGIQVAFGSTVSLEGVKKRPMNLQPVHIKEVGEIDSMKEWATVEEEHEPIQDEPEEGGRPN